MKTKNVSRNSRQSVSRQLTDGSVNAFLAGSHSSAVTFRFLEARVALADE
jgi:hypothetical protein